ncbi:hypothetical protein FOZ61_003627, partial [Perkinsus olseni]
DVRCNTRRVLLLPNRYPRWRVRKPRHHSLPVGSGLHLWDLLLPWIPRLCSLPGLPTA